MIDHLDHIVLTTSRKAACIAFYTGVLGMRMESLMGGTPPAERKSFHFGNQKINVRPTGDESWVTSKVDTPGALDLCFVTSSTPAETVAHFKACGVKVVEGPTTRSGALGAFVSVYCHDPEGNLIEVSSYPETSS